MNKFFHFLLVLILCVTIPSLAFPKSEEFPPLCPKVSDFSNIKDFYIANDLNNGYTFGGHLELIASSGWIYNSYNHWLVSASHITVNKGAEANLLDYLYKAEGPSTQNALEDKDPFGSSSWLCKYSYPADPSASVTATMPK